MKVADAFRQLANFGQRTRSGQSENLRGALRTTGQSSCLIKFETGIERFRSVIKSQSEIRSVKTHDSAESFSGATCQEPQPRSPDRVFALQPFC
jgi:hypothetical protein